MFDSILDVVERHHALPEAVTGTIRAGIHDRLAALEDAGQLQPQDFGFLVDDFDGLLSALSGKCLASQAAAN
jgi:hypothetical protein